MTAPRFTVKEVRFYERDMTLRLPFRFGAVTVSHAPQVFVRAWIALEDGNEGWGVATELMVPKWFDKNPALSNDDNFNQLRLALALTRDAYCAAGIDNAFGFLAHNNDALLAEGKTRGLDALVVNFGPALVDRAILDALCRLLGISFYQAVQENVPGMHREVLPPDLDTFDIGRFLSSLRPTMEIEARHTIGMTDPLTAADQSAAGTVDDGLPRSLEEAIATYGHRYFKIKVRGDLAADTERLAAIAAVLDRRDAPYWVTLDGNEQYEEVDGVASLLAAIKADERLRRFRNSILFIEQPLKRSRLLDCDVHALELPVIIDESDGDRDAFLYARARGYKGVSSKNCKGFYRSLINAARCADGNQTNKNFFISGEDLTCPAGIAVQQDLALVSLLGLGHVERNGHHYVGGMAGAPQAECDAFQAAHPNLYSTLAGRPHLKIQDGRIATRSLACTGFATGAEPDWRHLREV